MMSSDSNSDSSFECELPPGFLDPLPENQRLMSVDSGAVETSGSKVAAGVLDLSHAPSLDSGGKVHLNGMDDAIKPRKRPSNARYYLEDEASDAADMQDFVARKRANDSSSSSHKIAKSSSSQRHKVMTMSDMTWMSQPLHDGRPRITELIPSYKGHVAHFIWKGHDRGVIICHNRNSTLRKWSIQREEAKSLIEESGLYHLIAIMYKHIDWPLLSAFVERWHPETNSFHLPFGEMTITLHDLWFLLQIPVDGRPVITTWDDVGALSIALGLTKKLVKDTLWKGGRLSLKKLKSLDEPNTNAGVLAKGYLLRLLSASLFVDKSGNSVHGSFIQLLNEPGDVNSYAWGAATLANLYRQLGTASRNKCRQIAGCLTLLQAWIYAYFPRLRPQEQPGWQVGYPHASRWIPEKGRSNNKDVQSLKKHRLYLDRCSSSSVDWTPFSPYPATEVPISLFRGIIHCRSIAEPYMPDRVMRQFGYVQEIPQRPITPMREFRGANNLQYVCEHLPNTNFFENWSSHTLRVDQDVQRALDAEQCVQSYLEWFIPRTHTQVSRNVGMEGEEVLPHQQDCHTLLNLEQKSGIKIVERLEVTPLEVGEKRYLSLDLSKGMEGKPVFLFNDVDDNKEPVRFEYLVRSALSAHLFDGGASGIGCECEGECGVGCACYVRNGGEFPYDGNGVLVRGKPLVFECGPCCQCKSSCRNCVSQKGVKNRFEVFRMKEGGWGVRSLDLIQAGSFICEYAGVVLPRHLVPLCTINGDSLIYPSRFAERWREWGNLSQVFSDNVPPSYPSFPSLDFAMEVSKMRNVASYISHSSSPNVFVQLVLFDHNNASFPHIMLFAMENISPMTELTLDYRVADR